MRRMRRIGLGMIAAAVLMSAVFLPHADAPDAAQAAGQHTPLPYMAAPAVTAAPTPAADALREPRSALWRTCPAEARVLWHQLDDTERAVFAVLYDAMAEGGEGEGTLPCLLSEHSRSRVRFVLAYDCPELNTMNRDVVWFSVYRTGFRIPRTPEEAAALRDKAARWIQIGRELLAGTAGDVPAMQVRIDEWLTAHVTYDAAVTMNGIIPDRDSECWTAEGALSGGRAVCQGYAMAAMLLLRAQGVPCLYLRGLLTDGGTHGWLAVNAGGEWYGWDPTWDDADDDLLLTGHHPYLNVNGEMLARTRTLSAEYADFGFEVPEMTRTDLSPYVLAGQTADADWEERIAAAEADGGSFALYFTSDAAFRAASSALGGTRSRAYIWWSYPDVRTIHGVFQ